MDKETEHTVEIGVTMREEMKECIQLNLTNYAQEELNDRAKGDCCGIKIKNPYLRYYKGWLVEVGMALNLSKELERRWRKESRRFFWRTHEVDVLAVATVLLSLCAMWFIETMSYRFIIGFGGLTIFIILFGLYTSREE